jgi:hypothetical protein
MVELFPTSVEMPFQSSIYLFTLAAKQPAQTNLNPQHQIHLLKLALNKWQCSRNWQEYPRVHCHCINNKPTPQNPLPIFRPDVLLLHERQFQKMWQTQLYSSFAAFN